MAKRKKEEIEVYVEKVSAKEIEGEYDTRDLCAQFSDKELMKKCQLVAVVLSIENSRIIRIGLLNRKSKHFAKSVDSAF